MSLSPKPEQQHREQWDHYLFSKIGRTMTVFALRAYQPSARRVYPPAALP
jgi:hypothetical protein